MKTPQFVAAWAICDERAGVLAFTVRGTRRDAINAFLKVAYPPELRTMATWRKEREKGWRASHVGIQEYLFQSSDVNP